jgi:hypothetical protein
LYDEEFVYGVDVSTVRMATYLQVAIIARVLISARLEVVKGNECDTNRRQD